MYIKITAQTGTLYIVVSYMPTSSLELLIFAHFLRFSVQRRYPCGTSTSALTVLRQQVTWLKKTKKTHDVDVVVVPTFSAADAVAAFSAAADAPYCPTVSAAPSLSDLLPVLRH